MNRVDSLSKCLFNIKQRTRSENDESSQHGSFQYTHDDVLPY